jgi:hypothetical protein
MTVSQINIGLISHLSLLSWRDQKQATYLTNVKKKQYATYLKELLNSLLKCYLMNLKF